MGCNQSVDTDILVHVNLNSPIFNSESISVKSTVRTLFKDLCKKVILDNISSNYSPKALSYRITFKGKEYSLEDSNRIYNLRLQPNDTLTIIGIPMEIKKSNILITYFSATSRYETEKEVSKLALIKTIVEKPNSKVIYGQLELEHDQKFDDYDIPSNTRLHILEDGHNINEIQMWKIKKSGLVLEALCLNINCSAFKQRIIINIGLGEFDINAEISQDNEKQCGCCGAVLGKVCKVGYAHCVVSYTAILSDGNSKEVINKIKMYSEENMNSLPGYVNIVKYI
ncbi:hypothetical protein SteCoe_20265 [Stentor coeruleus]|uniref:Ubiquitin-like domain-containing protein n=1 Tax=Stentor coeruleus TaxID=5963 RepID=A0A1R2BSK8_9CILI|nr:hypothetical protein SteCoe_20265 [Stentor coeruleus]